MKRMNDVPYWSIDLEEVMGMLESSLEGLPAPEAAARLAMYGENVVRPKRHLSQLQLFLNQFKNPIILILLFATAVSAVTGDWFDAQIILLIVLASALLSFYQEYSAGQAIEKLRSKVQVTCSVKRDGKYMDVPSRLVVPGDVVRLSGGNLIPADGLLLESWDLFVNQSVLTGESVSVEKRVGTVPVDSGAEERTNCLFMGTSVFSGMGTMLVTETGTATQYGGIAEQLALRPPETDFERGIRHFGYLLTQIMLVLTLIVFAINVLLEKPALDSLLFSVALAVGITPQLLPAIISITLSKGARTMAKVGVIIRRLNSIENFGSMDVLCTDKTGTLTQGDIQLDGAVDVDGHDSQKVFRLAFLNASLQTGMSNNLDEAIKKYQILDVQGVEKVGEVPFDFNRRRLGVLFRERGEECLVVKGAFSSVFEVCSSIEVGGVPKFKDAQTVAAVERHYQEWSSQGIRVLGVAYKTGMIPGEVTVGNESDMIFAGFLLFSDHPKEDAATTIENLASRGVGLRIITGDNKLIALHTAHSVGIEVTGVLTGRELRLMSDEALWQRVETTNLFAEVDPNQKERIILALKKQNHVVGYMGDGINDVPALHAADVSISVDNAVDVAKESADIVLMEKSLTILSRGIQEGRTTFSNTLKYIWVTTSANFGNMFSVAGISLLLPFFPLLPKQILLLNFLSDFPALTLSNDAVDEDMLRTPQTWNIRFIRNFMFVFGLVSSVFDYFITFILFNLFRESQVLYQSSWFTFSLLTELITLIVIRTRKPFYRSRPANLLLSSTIFVSVVTLLLPHTSLAQLFTLEPIPLQVIGILFLLLALYVLAMEITKHFFYRRSHTPRQRSVLPGGISTHSK